MRQLHLGQRYKSPHIKAGYKGARFFSYSEILSCNMGYEPNHSDVAARAPVPAHKAQDLSQSVAQYLHL